MDEEACCMIQLWMNWLLGSPKFYHSFMLKAHVSFITFAVMHHTQWVHFPKLILYRWCSFLFVNFCRLSDLKMNWNVILPLNLGMPMPRYSSVKVIVVPGLCAISKLFHWSSVHVLCFSLSFACDVFTDATYAGHMEVEKKTILCVMCLDLKTTKWSCWDMFLLLIVR